MKNTVFLSAAGILALALSGCMGTKAVSHNITNEGTVAADDIVFPDPDKAWQKQGIFPNLENLSKIRAGIGKDDLYNLIGRPHFSEANKAREWDYLMKFYGPQDIVQVCQYKIIFDKDYNAQEFYWSPSECVNYVKPVTPVAPAPRAQPTVIVQNAPAISEQITLGADALFAFDRYKAHDMLPQGRHELDALADKLNSYRQKGRVQVMITGHTDRLGNDMYNMNLSLLRAQTVRAYLISRGVDSSSIWATGAGESQPVVQCAESLPKKQAIDCLQPNRRVEVNVTVQ